MHALAARRRGLDVLHLEREPEPRGASVRNFGLIWVSGSIVSGERDAAMSVIRTSPVLLANGSKREEEFMYPLLFKRVQAIFNISVVMRNNAVLVRCLG
jgi:hypothetical protein